MLEDLLGSLFGGQKKSTVQPRFGGGSTGNPPGVLSFGGEYNVPTDGSPMDIGGSGPPRQKPKGSEHKGLFGMKGNLREIFGILGDALNKGDPIYRPQRQNEKYSDAMQGFGENPMEALQRAYAVDRERASKDYDMYADNERDRKKGELETQRYETKEARESGEYEGKMYDRAARLMNPKVVNAKNWGATKDLYLRVLKKNGLEPPIDLPDEFDPEIANRIFSGGIEADDQLRIETQGRNADLSEARLRELEENNAFNRRDKAINTQSVTGARAVTTYKTLDEMKNPGKYSKDGSKTRTPPAIGGRPDKPPTKAGQVAIDNETGVTWISRNGKTWVKK